MLGVKKKVSPGAPLVSRGEKGNKMRKSPFEGELSRRVPGIRQGDYWRLISAGQMGIMF